MYILATYYRVPKDGTQTTIAGYMKDSENYMWDESIAFSRNLKPRDIKQANVILDLINEKLVKCSVGELVGKDYQTVFAYFKESYPDHINELLRILNQTTQNETPAEPIVLTDVAEIRSN